MQLAPIQIFVGVGGGLVSGTLYMGQGQSVVVLQSVISGGGLWPISVG